MTNYYNKLVRDRIPEIIRSEGRECAVKIMEIDEYYHALREKLIEEAQETANAEPGDMVKELADLYEVIDTVIKVFNLDKDVILTIQQKLRDERGGFEKRLKLIGTD